MSLSKKRKVDKECRVFQDSWSVSYFFTEMIGIPVCLVCSQQVSVVKEYNIRRHYETHHAERYRGLQGQPRREKVKELIAGLKKQQSVFASGWDISAAAVKASYLIANDIALPSKPYYEGELRFWGGFGFICGGLTLQKLTKTQLIYSVWCFNLGSIGTLFWGDKALKTPPWRRDWRRYNTLAWELSTFDNVRFGVYSTHLFKQKHCLLAVRFIGLFYWILERNE